MRQKPIPCTIHFPDHFGKSLDQCRILETDHSLVLFEQWHQALLYRFYQFDQKGEALFFKNKTNQTTFIQLTIKIELTGFNFKSGRRKAGSSSHWHSTKLCCGGQITPSRCLGDASEHSSKSNGSCHVYFIFSCQANKWFFRWFWILFRNICQTFSAQLSWTSKTRLVYSDK